MSNEKKPLTDEVVTYEPAITSDFVHSQHYIVNQLIPELTEQVYSMMFIGTEAEAKAKANTDKIGRASCRERVCLSV